MEGGNALVLGKQPQKEGVPDLRQSGVKKVKDGMTSLAVIPRVT